MRPWQVKDNAIHMSAEESDMRLTALLKEYKKLVTKLEDYTPEETVNVLRSGYREWLGAVEPSFNLRLIEELDKIIIKMGADPYWDVPFKLQRQTAKTFTMFLKTVKKENIDKKDSVALTVALNEAFGKNFNVGADNRSINTAINSSKQMRKVAKRLFKRIEKMGYSL